MPASIPAVTYLEHIVHISERFHPRLDESLHEGLHVRLTALGLKAGRPREDHQGDIVPDLFVISRERVRRVNAPVENRAVEDMLDTIKRRSRRKAYERRQFTRRKRLPADL